MENKRIEHTTLQRCYDLIIGDQNFWDMLSDEAKAYAEDKLYNEELK